MPHMWAGMRIDPPVSLPRLASPWPLATAAAEPPDEPPGIWPIRHGLWQVPKNGLSVLTPQAHSCMLALPTSTAPACAKRAVVVASCLGR